MRTVLNCAIWLAAIAGFALGTSARGDVYGLDIVPSSMFHHGAWNFYGSDAVPNSTTHDFGLRTTYAWDDVPLSWHPHVAYHERAVLVETVQRLTSATQSEPTIRRRVRP